ncbi:UNVERIFIED_CONTAM: hypothetical protein Slati_2751000 [Sesamum latifolium]|uniref:Uncharacterized protein n=1 Tax=Sesamum latifolium TaxID=2727402 RepID=A0AAW2VXN7_9LAMI
MPALYLRAYSWMSALYLRAYSWMPALYLKAYSWVSALYLRAYFRGALLGARLRNLAGRIVRCPPEGGLRCLHGTELTSSPEKYLGACPNEGLVASTKEGLCACVEDRAFVPMWKTWLFMRRCLPRSRALIKEV